MPITGFISKSWPELVATATEAVQNQDLITLKELDAVFRDRFLDVTQRREPVGAFVDSTLEILATPETSEIVRDIDPTAELLAQWTLLAGLAQSLERIEQFQRNAVERHVTGRPRREQILRYLTEHGETRFQELKAELGVSDANLSGLLGELELHTIVARERRGNETFVRLGQAALAHAGRNVVELPLAAYRRAIEPYVAEDDFLPSIKFA